MKFKQLMICAALGVSPLIANAGIPVIDATANAQSAANFVRDMAEQAKRLMELKNQLEQQKRTYEAMIGSRDIGKLFNDPRLAQYLPQGMQGLYGDIKNRNISGMADKMAQLSAQYANGHNQAVNQQNIEQARKANAQKNKIIIDQVFESSQQRLNQLTSLMNSIDSTQDPKAAADLGNRINSEVALLQAEQSKIQLVKQLAEAEDKLIAEQQRAAVKAYNTGSGKTPPRAARTYTN